MTVSKQSTPPLDASADSNARKRVCKACDRCRLKKSKCDGSSPCNRCRIDNAICVFGERKKSHDKAYPKGYVEMLEQQQAQLVHGLQELYKRVQNGQGWPGQTLKDAGNGHPLTHDILESLGALKHDSTGSENFEEDLNLMQQRLIESGAGDMQRQASNSSDSGYGHSPVSSTASGPVQFGADQFSIYQAPLTPPDQKAMFLPYETSDISIQFQQPPMQDQVLFDMPNTMNAMMRQQMLRQQQQQQPQFAQPPQAYNGSPLDFADGMDFMRKFDTSAYVGPMPMQQNLSPMQPYMASPTLPMPDWNEEDELKAFINPQVV